MAEVNNKVIRITVETDKAKIKIEGVEQYFRKAETAAKALNKILDQNTKHWGRTEVALSQQISSLKDLRAKTAGTTEEYQRQTKEIDRLQSEYEQLTSAQGKVSKSMGSMQSSAGLAGATVNELGRTISDMPYGITAISNNISQLGSLFAILVSKTGSVTNAFKSLFATLRASPALVILLAFQAVVAIIDVLAQNSKKAKQGIDDIAKASGGAAINLKILKDVLNDENISLEQKEKALGKVNSQYKEMDLRLDAHAKLTDDSVIAIDKEIEALERLAEAQVLVNQIKKTFEDIAALKRKGGEDVANIYDKALQFIKLNSLVDLVIPYGADIFGTDRFSENVKKAGEERRDALVSELRETAKSLLEEYKKIGNFDNLSPDEDTPISKLDAFLQKWREKREDAEVKTKLALIHLEEQRVIEQAKILGASDSQLSDIEAVFRYKRYKLKDEEYKELLKLQQEYFNQELDLIEENNNQIDSLLKDITAKRKDEPLIRFSGYDFDDLDVDASIDELLQKNKDREAARIQSLNDTIAVAQAVGAVVSGVADNIDAAYQKEIGIEQNKTNALNNELRERLANEQLSADERRNIQDQIAKNDESLRKKQEAIERKRFKANKAAAIAEATISTFLAAAKTLRDTEGGSVARIAGMIAVIGAGLAQVAMISKQQFASSQSSIGAGAGVGSGGNNQVQAPEFNIVGQSASNQIAAAVQGQFSQPIRAYVVSKEMSTAQEMDRNIIGASSLG
tara:strand:+ start:1880 stop:4099 length:2220 start_codon:yes stop_codon:yes gene_type:complete